MVEIRTIIKSAGGGPQNVKEGKDDPPFLTIIVGPSMATSKLKAVKPLKSSQEYPIP